MNTISVPTVVQINPDAIYQMNKKDIAILLDACVKALNIEQPAPIPNHIAAISVKDMGLQTQTVNRLISHDLYTLGQLMMYSEKQLLAINYFGKTALKDIKTALQAPKLKQFNLKLRTT